MEPQRDGSVLIGVAIVATVGQSDIPDPAFNASAEWARCDASHQHGWESCDIPSLFGARQQRPKHDDEKKPVVDDKGKTVMEDIPGTSKRERLLAWLDARRQEAANPIPKEIPLPTRKVKKEGKDVDEPIKGVSL
jgi:hypothetical protein